MTVRQWGRQMLMDLILLSISLGLWGLVQYDLIVLVQNSAVLGLNFGVLAASLFYVEDLGLVAVNLVLVHMVYRTFLLALEMCQCPASIHPEGTPFSVTKPDKHAA